MRPHLEDGLVPKAAVVQAVLEVQHDESCRVQRLLPLELPGRITPCPSSCPATAIVRPRGGTVLPFHDLKSPHEV